MTEIDEREFWDTTPGVRPAMWRHCSPALLGAGVSCGATPRRACRCPHGGSHDHLIDTSWLEHDGAGRDYMATIRGAAAVPLLGRQ